MNNSCYICILYQEEILKRLVYIVSMVSVMMLALSCSHNADKHTRDVVDSLNVLSCKMLYVSAHESEDIAKKALAKSDGYHDGKMEALCNIAHAR